MYLFKRYLDSIGISRSRQHSLSHKTIDISRLKLIDTQVCIFVSYMGKIKTHDYIKEYYIPRSFRNMLNDTY